MILSHLPALDLLVVQMVNRTCRDIVTDSTRFQVKLFMKQVPPHWRNQVVASEFRWNPFLERYGYPRCPPLGSHDHHLWIWFRRRALRRIGRPSYLQRVLREKDRSEASWTKMYVSYPTRRVRVKCRLFSGTEERDVFFISNHGPSMAYLKEVDRVCTARGSRSTRSDTFYIRLCCDDIGRLQAF